MFILTSLLSLLLGNRLDALDLLGADIYVFITEGQIWRVLTATFLHANVFHLAVNMYALHYFGRFIESQYGGKKLFALYILSGIAGSLLSAIVTSIEIWLGNEGAAYTVGVGASGALFGILGYILIIPNYYINKQHLYYILFLNLFIGFLFAGLIDNWAHIGGLLGGILVGYIDKNARIIMEPQRSYYISLVLLVASFIALIAYNIFQITML